MHVLPSPQMAHDALRRPLESLRQARIQPPRRIVHISRTSTVLSQRRPLKSQAPRLAHDAPRRNRLQKTHLFSQTTRTRN